jgi:hypothetical protein
LLTQQILFTLTDLVAKMKLAGGFAVLCIAALGAACSDSGEVVASNTPLPSYGIQDVRSDIPTHWTLERLVKEERRVLEQLLEQFPNEHQKEAVQRAIDPANAAAIYAVKGDSIAARLISQIYALRALVREHDHRGLGTPGIVSSVLPVRPDQE